jgi:hypothetical protein
MKREKINIKGNIACLVMAAAFLFVMSCDMLTPPVIPSAISKKTGDTATVSINFALPGRSVFPAAVFENYEFLFSRDGDPAENIEPNTLGGFTFTLEAGVEWSLTIKAYAGEIDEENLAATGSAVITLNNGDDRNVTIILTGNTSAAGKGTFTYTVTMPAGAAIDSIKLEKINEEGLGDNELSGTET